MTTRRTFLTQAAMLSAGAMMIPELLSAKAKCVAGLQLYTLRDQLPKDVKGTIARVAKAGYKEVETFGYDAHNGFWGISAAEFARLLKANGLTSPSGHYGGNALFETGSMKEIDEAIKVANILGQQYVTIPYIDAKFRKTAADLKAIAQKLNLAGAHVKKAGLKLGYHNHNFEFEPVEGQMLYEVMLSQTDRNLVHFEMDLYWVVRAGQDPLKWIDKHPGRFEMVHVKDMDKKQHDLNTEVGKGSVNFKAIFLKAAKAGIKHYIVEQENFKIDPYVSITESCRYLKSIIPA